MTKAITKIDFGKGLVVLLGSDCVDGIMGGNILLASSFVIVNSGVSEIIKFWKRPLLKLKR